MFNLHLDTLLSSTAYVQVRRNQFRVRKLDSGEDITVVSQTPFTTERLLVSQFDAAQSTLKDALTQMAQGCFFAVSPRLVIHPLEMVDGGLSDIEKRIFREVGMGAGASRVVVCVGHELNDTEVKDKLSAIPTDGGACA